MRHDIALSNWRLALADGIVRLPVRNKAMRSARFEDRYDSQTLLYDVFWDASCSTVIAVAAPFLGLADDLPIDVVAMPSGRRCEVRREAWPHFERLLISPPAGTVALAFETKIGRVVRAIQPNIADALAGTRLVYTLQKDNDLVWIRDWAQFYVREHGADAVVLYDNSSTRYERAEIANALEAIAGLRHVVVLGWDFPYGAFDLREERSLNCFDGIYCQFAAFHHALWRLGSRASGFVNADIDELVVRHGTRSLFDALATSETGYIMFSGFWVENVRAPARSGSRRHRDYSFIEVSNPPVAEPKWAIRPTTLPADAFLHVHHVGNTYPTPAEDQTLYHFRAINPMWDADRPHHLPRRTERMATDEIVSDRRLAAALDRAFEDDGALVAIRPSPNPAISGLVARLRSARAAAEGDAAAAIALAEAAVRDAPEMPSYREHLAGLVVDPARAAKLLAEADELRRCDYGYYYQLAEQAKINDRLEDAVVALRRSLDLAPANPAALSSLLICLDHFERTNEMEEIARRAADDLPSPHLVLRDAMDLFGRTMRWNEAEALLLHALERAPEDHGLHSLLAEVRISLKDIAGAREALDRAWATMTPAWSRELFALVQASSQFVWPGWRCTVSQGFLHTLEGALAVHAGRRDEAATFALEAARRGYPARSLGLGLRASQLLQAAGRIGEAGAALEQAIAIGRRPEFTMPGIERGPNVARWWREANTAKLARAFIAAGDDAAADRLIESGRSEPTVLVQTLKAAAQSWLERGADAKAEAAAREIVAVAPKDSGALLLLAQVHLRQNDSARAREAAEAAILAGADIAKASFLLAQVEMAEEHFEAAAALARTVFERQPGRNDARALLVRALIRSGDGEAAAAEAREALARAPELPRNHLNLADALVKAGQPDGAVEALIAAAAAFPDHAEIATALARELHRAGRFGEAEQAALGAIALAPNRWQNHLFLGRARIALRDANGAEAALKVAIEMDPSGGAEPMRVLAQHILGQGRVEEAHALACKAVRLGSGRAQELLLSIEARQSALKRNPGLV